MLAVASRAPKALNKQGTHKRKSIDNAPTNLLLYLAIFSETHTYDQLLVCYCLHNDCHMRCDQISPHRRTNIKIVPVLFSTLPGPFLEITAMTMTKMVRLIVIMQISGSR